VERKSPINGFNFLLTFTNGLLNTPEGTLRQLAAFMTNACGAEVSGQALDERIHRMGADFLKACLEKAMKIASAPLRLSDELARRFNHILIIDSTNFDLHKSLEDKFKGSKGSASKSSMRIQFLFDYVTGAIHVEIGDVKLADATTLNEIVALDKIDTEGSCLFLSDLGYFKTDTFVRIDQELNGFFISKMRNNVKILDVDGNEIKLYDALKRGLERIDLIVKIGELECRLIGEKLDDKIINQRLRRANTDNERKGKTVSKEHKLFLAYGLFITNLSADFNFNAVYTIYRLRWQIELIFKTWKSILKIHCLRSAKETNVRCKVYGKLIIATIANAICRNARLCFERELSFHRVLQHVKVVAVEWTCHILANVESHRRFLCDMVTQVRRYCKKSRQRKRPTIEWLLDELDFGLKGEKV
jgi:hypothetical protein